jgi:ABC-type multidrug transport system permease subunit
MIKKEFRLLRTDPGNLFIALLIPPLIILLFSFMVSEGGEPSAMNVVVLSHDSNTFINENNLTETHLDNYTIPYVDAVNESKYLNLKGYYNTTEEVYAMKEARGLLEEGNISCIIVLPPEFSELLIWGFPGIIECVPDSSSFRDIQDNLNAVYDSIKVFTQANNLTPQFKIEGYEEFAIPQGYNARFNSSTTLILSLMVYGIAVVLTILVVVKEKPIARLLLTPVKRIELLLSKYISYTLVLILQITLILVSALYGGLYIRGSLMDLFIALFIIGFSGINVGMFISSVSKTKTEANQLFFATFIVFVLLSGIFVPIESMPDYLKNVAYLLPLTHAHPLLESILTKGKSVFGFHFNTLIIISSVLMLIAFITFYKRRYEV